MIKIIEAEHSHLFFCEEDWNVGYDERMHGLKLNHKEKHSAADFGVANNHEKRQQQART